MLLNFLLFSISVFPSGFISLHSEQLYLFMYLSLAGNAFPLHSWSIFLLAIEFWIDRLFFCPDFKELVPLSSGLHDFWWEIHSLSIHYSLPWSISFSSSSFQEFFLFLIWFSVVWFWCSCGWFSLSLSCLKFALFLVIVNLCILPNFRSFSHFYKIYTFSALDSFSSPSGTPMAQM